MNRISLLIFTLLATLTATAQYRIQEAPQWEFEAKVGFNIGGSSPVPIPREIRKIDSYRPTMGIPLELTATLWSDIWPYWGLTTGVKIGNEGMKTRATVKNYHTAIVGDQGETVEGYWTGGVETRATATRLSVPVLMAFRPNRNWTFRFGPTFSWLLEKEFSGKVYDGYIRENTPTGQRSEINGDRYSTYDFSNDIQTFRVGVRAGASLRVYRSFHVFTDLSADLTPLFKRDFKTITFDLYPIYLNTGVSYKF